MATTVIAQYSRSDLAGDVRAGLLRSGQKELPSKYLYDEVGSALFEVISVLPEYGLTRADERLLRRHASDIVARLKPQVLVAELGSGSGKKTRWLLEALTRRQRHHLLPDRAFAHRPGSLCDRAGPDRIRQHRRLRAPLSRRAAGGRLQTTEGRSFARTLSGEHDWKF